MIFVQEFSAAEVNYYQTASLNCTGKEMFSECDPTSNTTRVCSSVKVKCSGIE